MKFIGNSNEYLHLQVIKSDNCYVLKEIIESSLTILWFEEEGTILLIDGKECVFKKNEIVFLTQFHKIVVVKISSIRMVRFNKAFYCILHNDVEVSCKGILFFGATQLPVISISEEELEKFEILWKMFQIEMTSTDSLQIGMLQMMLQRYLILGTRIYKQKEAYPENTETSDLIREFNYLVELHFKEKHTVAEYAELLFKSPKTISNVFLKMGTKTPLRYIHDRKVLEARRLLTYSNLQVKEIAHQIGFNDVQTFSRFFKKYEGVSPTEYKEKSLKGKNANS